jgi:hypothetical protein
LGYSEDMRSHSPKRIAPTWRHVLTALCSVAMATAMLLPCSALAKGNHSAPAVETVVVVLSPFLTWDDVAKIEPAYIRLAGSEGAIGNMNAITGDAGWPTVAGGALTLSASRWTAAPIGTAADPRHLDAIKAANAGSLDPPDIGALGSAIHEAGKRTAAVGNSDESTSTPGGIRRPAALLAMDRDGKVDIELTSPGLLKPDASAPFGVRADPKQLRKAIRIALADQPALLVVDPGDLERAHDAPNQSAEQAALNHAEAVKALNEVVSDVQVAVGTRPTLLMVVTPATDKPYYQPPYFGPTIVTGINLDGQITSPSTHRPGLVTNLDVAPTVLSALWIEPGATMLGQPMTTPSLGTASEHPLGANVDASIRRLETLGTSVGSVDYVRDLFFIRFFAWASALIAMLAAAIALMPALRSAASAVRWLILLALTVPGGAWLMFVANRYPQTPAQAALAFGAMTLAIFALVAGLSTVLKVRPEVPLVAVSTLTTLLVLADQWTGHPLETGLFSYSIRAGWRYYGMGNEGAALLVGASIVAVGLACDLYAESERARALRVGLMPAVAVVVLLTAAAPFAGANAGVALWGVVAYGVAWLRINRIRVTWKSALAMLAAILALIAALAAVDMLLGSGETHLGRFIGDLLRGDFSAVGNLVYRKASNNLGYISQTPYTWLAIAIVGALAAVRWAGDHPLVATLRDRPGLAGALAGVLAGGVVATATEDSGVVMPALMLFAGALPVLSLVLAKKSLDPDVT